MFDENRNQAGKFIKYFCTNAHSFIRKKNNYFQNNQKNRYTILKWDCLYRIFKAPRT